jgi:hypothetical protein
MSIAAGCVIAPVTELHKVATFGCKINIIYAIDVMLPGHLRRLLTDRFGICQIQLSIGVEAT